MCQAAAQQLPRCLRSTACASSGLMSLEHCLKSAAVCCGPSCGLISPTGAQAPSLRSRQGARSAVSVPHCCATEAVGVYLLAMWRNALSLCTRAGSSYWFRIQYSATCGWAGRLLMCLVGRPTDNVRPLRSSDDHRYSGRPLAHVLHCLNSQDGMMCEFGSINSASKRQPSSKFEHHVSQSACPREWYVAATTSALGAVRCVVIHRLQAS